MCVDQNSGECKFESRLGQLSTFFHSLTLDVQLLCLRIVVGCYILLLSIVSYRQIPGVDLIHTCFATFESDFLQVPQEYGTIVYAPNTSNGKV